MYFRFGLILTQSKAGCNHSNCTAVEFACALLPAVLLVYAELL